MLDRPVHLFLHVKVSERWAEDPSHYRAIGLDYEPKRLTLVRPALSASAPLVPSIRIMA